MDCLEQRVTKECFSRQEQMYFGDCDSMGRARLGVILGKMAEASGHDFDARGWSHEIMSEAGQAMLLSRLTMKFNRTPRYHEILTFTTWFGGTRGTFFHRYYDVADEAGHCLISGKSDWLLVHPANRRIVKPRDFIGDTKAQGKEAPDCPECGKLTPPDEDCFPLGSRRVAYSDLDKNGHLFSGRYGDVFWDFLPGPLQARNPMVFSINYNKEAVLGQGLELSGCHLDDVFYMQGFLDGSLCFSGECIFR